MKIVFLGMGVLDTLFWLYILIDFILTVTFGWPDRDLAFGLVLLLVFPIIPALSFCAVAYLKHLEAR